MPAIGIMGVARRNDDPAAVMDGTWVGTVEMAPSDSCSHND